MQVGAMAATVEGHILSEGGAGGLSLCAMRYAEALGLCDGAGWAVAVAVGGGLFLGGGARRGLAALGQLAAK